MDAILEDYTETSVIISPDEVMRGPDEMRPLFEAFFTEFGKPGLSFEMKKQVVEGEAAYIVWSAETADNIYELGTDTFIVRDGKIAIQSFAVKVVPKSRRG